MCETISFGCHFETNDRGPKTSLSTESFIVIVYGKEDLIYSAPATFSADNLSAHMIGGFQVPLRQ